MTMQNMYDLAVIGAGPAGIVGATTAASLGARVVLIDRYGDLGGAGANTGTVPSKTLRETALALSGTRSRDLYGVDLSLRREATIADLMRREHVVGAIRDVTHGIDKNLPVTNVAQLPDVLNESVAQPRFRTLLLGFFGAIALILAGVGIFRVISYSVSPRRSKNDVLAAKSCVPRVTIVNLCSMEED